MQTATSGSANRKGTGQSGAAARSRAGRRITLFEIPFKSAMTETDLGRLRSELDMVTYIVPKPGVSGAEPGVVPLDSWSGLFLKHGEGENQWVLEARTWNKPPESLVHAWHVRAAIAARELDPRVTIPPIGHASEPEPPNHPVGRAENKLLTRLGHRILHLE